MPFAKYSEVFGVDAYQHLVLGFPVKKIWLYGKMCIFAGKPLIFPKNPEREKIFGRRKNTMIKMKKKIVAAVLVTALLVTGMPELFVNEVSAEEMMWRGEGEMLTVETPTVEKPSHSPSQGRLENPRTDSDGVVTWDCVYFGNYWQRKDK